MAALEERCYFELGITELRALLEHGYLFLSGTDDSRRDIPVSRLTSNKVHRQLPQHNHDIDTSLFEGSIINKS
jgi:hypothetical protein